MSNQSKGRPGGVLPINAAATKKTSAPQKSAQRSPAPRLRLIIRRLPPGLTETEFWDALGTEWQTGNGKVDWHAFKEGKISKDPAKPSKPGRAYIKVKDQSLLEALSAKVKSTPFKDAKATGNDPCLIGPPSLEFAPYSKSPSSRNRNDGRQGTIDQDQEFIDFLQSLTEPITKAAANGAETSDLKQEKTMTTPLVQFIKEKKANRVKEKEAAAAAKSSKKNQEGKEGKTKGESRPTIVVKSNAATAEKARIAKATQEAVKAANKSAAQIQSKTTASKPEPKIAKEVVNPAAPATSTTPAPASTPAPKPERRRGSASTASRMIARDLGLTTKEPRTPRAARNASNAVPSTTENAPKVETQLKTASSANVPATTSKSNTSTTTTPTTVPPAQVPPTGPRNSRSQTASQAKQAQPAAQRPGKPSPQPTAGAKSAFLKHANPSQGVTEDLLRTTFSTFGGVTRCEIDKKKGLGYVDFTETEALKKAMAASPIKVGNGQVVVLENKSPYQKRQTQPTSTAQQQSGAGAGSASKATSATSSAVASTVTSPQPMPAVVATTDNASAPIAPPTTAPTTSETLTSVEAVSSAATPTATPATPTAPKGARGGNNASRGGRGGTNFHPGRGGGSQGTNRGRGGFRNRGSRGNKAGANAASAGGSNATAPAPASTTSPAIDQGSASNVGKAASTEKA